MHTAADVHKNRSKLVREDRAESDSRTPFCQCIRLLLCRLQGGSGHLHNFIRLYPIHTVCKSGKPVDWRSKRRNNPKRFFGDAKTAHREHDTSALNASQHCAARQTVGIERYALIVKERSDQATENSLFLTGAFETIDIFQYKEIQPWQK